MSEQQKNDVLLNEVITSPESVVSAEVQAEQTPTQIISPGAQLASYRKLKNLSIDDAASFLKLAPRQINAIEADDYASLPGMAITRGFIRTYAKFLGIDPAPLLDALPKQEMRLGAVAGSERVQSGTFHESSLLLRDRNKLVPIGIAIAVAVAVVAAGAYFWHKSEGGAVSPLSLFSLNTEASADTQRQVVDSNVVDVPAAPVVANAAPETEKASDTLPKFEMLPVARVAVNTPAPAAAVTSVVVPAPVVAPAPAAVAPAATLPAVAAPAVKPPPEKVVESLSAPQKFAAIPAAAELAKPVIKVSNSKDLLRLTLRENAWVEIRRADGSIVFSRLLLAGSTESFDVPEPLQLVIGNASGVEATLRGAALALPLSKNNVARINLK